MLHIRIADVNFCIDNKYEFLEKMCKDYIYNGEPSVFISVTDDEINAEDTEKKLDKGYLESLAVYRKIAEKMTDYDGFLMHGVVADVNGTGVAFLAKSGVGKSTHANLWQQVLKEKMTIINGDKPLIRIIDEEIYAYGTPWSGKEGIHKNTNVKLKKICFLERAEQNECLVLKKEEVLQRLFPQVYNPKETSKLLTTMDLVEKLIEKCDFYIIRCNTEISAANTAIDEVMKPDIERALKEAKLYITQTNGDSMYPMLSCGDRVIIVPKKGALKKGDVAVYRRGDHYTMHRIVKVKKGGFIICGDNRTYLEKDVKENDIIGVLAAFYHDGKYIDCSSNNYRRYVKWVLFKLPIKILITKIKRAFS